MSTSENINIQMQEIIENATTTSATTGTTTSATAGTPIWTPGKFELIRDNIYLEREQRKILPKDIQQCDCKDKYDAEDNNNNNSSSNGSMKTCTDTGCINVSTYVECLKGFCATNCQNRLFTKRAYARIEPYNANEAGTGLRTLTDIRKGEFIVEYVGEVISEETLLTRMDKMENDFYFFGLTKDTYIDSFHKGNNSRYINHSCDPNCRSEKWSVGAELRLGFFADRDIKAGESLSLDYKWEAVGSLDQKCYCRSDNCRGSLTRTRKKTISSSSSSSSISSSNRFGDQPSVDTFDEDSFSDESPVRKEKFKSQLSLLEIRDYSNKATKDMETKARSVVAIEQQLPAAVVVTAPVAAPVVAPPVVVAPEPCVIVRNFPVVNSEHEFKEVEQALKGMVDRYGTLTYTFDHPRTPRSMCFKFHSEVVAMNASSSLRGTKFGARYLLAKTCSLDVYHSMVEKLESLDVVFQSHSFSRPTTTTTTATATTATTSATISYYSNDNIFSEAKTIPPTFEIRLNKSLLNKYIDYGKPPPLSLSIKEGLSTTKITLLEEFSHVICINLSEPDMNYIKIARRWIYKHKNVSLIFAKCMSCILELLLYNIDRDDRDMKGKIGRSVVLLINDVFMHPSMKPKFARLWSPLLSETFKIAVKKQSTSFAFRTKKMLEKWKDATMISKQDYKTLNETLDKMYGKALRELKSKEKKKTKNSKHKKHKIMKMRMKEDNKDDNEESDGGEIENDNGSNKRNRDYDCDVEHESSKRVKHTEEAT